MVDRFWVFVVGLEVLPNLVSYSVEIGVVMGKSAPLTLPDRRVYGGI